MKFVKSITGVVFAAIYATVFVVAYLNYRGHVGEWFADTWVILAAMPFILTMRFLAGGSFDLTGEDSLKLVAAALFCCALAFVGGAALEAILLRPLIRLARMFFVRARRGA